MTKGCDRVPSRFLDDAGHARLVQQLRQVPSSGARQVCFAGSLWVELARPPRTGSADCSHHQFRRQRARTRDNVTIGYVLEGHVTLEFGPGGTERVDVGPGEYFEVPKNVVHREGNMATSPGEVVLVRIGDGPVVFPVEGPDPA